MLVKGFTRHIVTSSCISLSSAGRHIVQPGYDGCAVIIEGQSAQPAASALAIHKLGNAYEHLPVKIF